MYLYTSEYFGLFVIPQKQKFPVKMFWLNIEINCDPRNFLTPMNVIQDVNMTTLNNMLLLTQGHLLLVIYSFLYTAQVYIQNLAYNVVELLSSILLLLSLFLFGTMNRMQVFLKACTCWQELQYLFFCLLIILLYIFMYIVLILLCINK